MRQILLTTAFVVLGGCLSSGPVPAPETGRPGPAATAADRAPLVRYPEEDAVVGAIATAGFRVDFVGPSKFEDHIFGERKRARAFGAMNDAGGHARVDVLFLDLPVGEVRVCPNSAPHEYSILNGGRQATVGSTQDIFFAVGDRFFVMASEAGVRDALSARFDLRVPSC